MMLISSISFIKFCIGLQVQTLLTFFTSLSFLPWVVGVTSAPKEEVKRLPGGKIKKKVRALKIFVPLDSVFMQPGSHENSNVI